MHQTKFYFISKLYLLFLFVVVSTSIMSYEKYNFLNADLCFEILVVMCLVFINKTTSQKAIVYYSITYILYGFLVSKLNDVSWLDFGLAYKSFFYILILGFFCGKQLFRASTICILYRFLLGAFLLKYILWYILSSTSRPGVFTENNFELLFLLLLSLAVFQEKKAFNITELSALISVVFLSGSRSATLALIIMLTILYIKKFSFSLLLKIAALVCLGIGVVAVFVSRMDISNLESIDRFVFLQEFLFSIKEFTLFDYVFGATPLTPLPSSTCDRLNYYQSLFSNSNDGTCYSVILHSYMMRTLYDHGLFGLFFVYYAINKFLVFSKIDFRMRLAIIMVIFVNSLSVSALNTVYSILGFIVILTTSYSSSRHCNDLLKISRG